jgi:hypothetical protein
MTTTMTYTTAIENAIRVLSATNENDETVERLQALAASLAKRNAHKASDATKAKQVAKRAEARAEVVNVVAPIVRKALTIVPSTAKEIFERCEGLPEGFNAAKVQYLLLHELAKEVTKTEAKGKANTYTLVG